jgi:hypothetical protein
MKAIVQDVYGEADVLPGRVEAVGKNVTTLKPRALIPTGERGRRLAELVGGREEHVVG